MKKGVCCFRPQIRDCADDILVSIEPPRLSSGKDPGVPFLWPYSALGAFTPIPLIRPQKGDLCREKPALQRYILWVKTKKHRTRHPFVPFTPTQKHRFIPL